jgi:hypothetical protein
MTVPGVICTMEKGGAGEREEWLVMDWAFVALYAWWGVGR